MHIYARDNTPGTYFELIFEIQKMNSNKTNFTRKHPRFRMQQLHCNLCINEFCRDFWLNQSIKKRFFDFTGKDWLHVRQFLKAGQKDINIRRCCNRPCNVNV